MNCAEANFDGIVGPTHNYSGLSTGNVASGRSKFSVALPKTAALQGLAKMKALADAGFLQAVLPPHERPSVQWLRHWGLPGRNDAEVLYNAAKSAPELLSAASSASAMWTANAGTVAPSQDTADGRLHFTAANLNSKLHRALEPAFTGRVMRRIFANEELFAHHPALDGGAAMGDEGAANHTRLAPSHAHSGLHVFVYGRQAQSPGAPAPRKFPARQSLEASQAIARLHQLDASHCCFIQQSPDAIDAGVFHNDVIAVGSTNLLLYHEQAFLNGGADIDRIRATYETLYGTQLSCLRVTNEAVPLQEAVNSYLFNSQLLALPEGGHLLVAPTECEENPAVAALLQSWLASAHHPIRRIRFFNLRESMRNGGGPACLRLRVVLNEKERTAIQANIWMNDNLYPQLVRWVERHYRDELHPAELADPLLLQESRSALDALTQILNLGNLYDFQQ